MSSDTLTIAIVGAGFSGAMVTAHLLRRDFGRPVRLVVVNKSGRIARGVAYGTHHSDHVLNVPAGRMSAFPDDEEHFLRFARAARPGTDGGSFVSRGIYGDYLAHIVEEAASRHGAPTLETLHDEVQAIRTEDDSAVLELAGGRTLRADQVVLALGNYLPSNPPLPDASAFQHRAYIRDPWAPGALDHVPADQPVLLIGTGLTMLDVALQLAPGRSAPMLAISRRGLLPQPHRDHGAPPSYGHLPPGLVAAEPSAVGYLRAVRGHVRKLAKAGIDWREVIASLRPVTPRLWQALPSREKSRFLRHLRPYWDVHRHRVAPDLFRRFETLCAEGSLATAAARLLGLGESGDQLVATIRRRGQGAAETQRFARVINCTGPESDVRAVRDPLLRQVVQDGVARPDALGLGLEVTDLLQVVTQDGSPSQAVSLVGPLLKGTWWEATAVPELRVHAARLAARLHESHATATVG